MAKAPNKLPSRMPEEASSANWSLTVRSCDAGQVRIDVANRLPQIGSQARGCRGAEDDVRGAGRPVLVEQEQHGIDRLIEIGVCGVASHADDGGVERGLPVDRRQPDGCAQRLGGAAGEVAARGLGRDDGHRCRAGLVRGFEAASGNHRDAGRRGSNPRW